MKEIMTCILTGILIIAGITSCHFTPGDEIYKTSFNEDDIMTDNCDFIFPDYKTDGYLDSLRKEFNIDSLVQHADSELHKALILLKWSHTRWEHSGSNTPEKSDAISILNEAKTGQNFRCTEYSIVLAGVLNSVGIPARVLGLKVKDVGSTLAGAGHVAVEAYLPELDKWIFLDAQSNYVPFLNQQPLNAIEYKNAIDNNAGQLVLKNIDEKFTDEDVKAYADWTGVYLFYLDARFDNRAGIMDEKITCKGKTHLMLVPLGADNPETFQVFSSMDYLLYTHNLKDFYKTPKVEE